jgi:hypothetical protein
VKIIKAIDLNLCRKWFRFWFCGKQYKFNQFTLNENIIVEPCNSGGLSRLVGHPPNMDIEVDEVKYELEVLRHIKRVLEYGTCKVMYISKDENGIFVDFEMPMGRGTTVHIKADPMPWLDRYEKEYKL